MRFAVLETAPSRIRLGFWEANNFAAFLPLSAFLEKLDPLKAL